MFVANNTYTQTERRELLIRRNGEDGWVSVNDFDVVEEFYNEDGEIVWAQVLASFNDGGTKLVEAKPVEVPRLNYQERDRFRS